jgi:peptidoglycan/LPS O-acetylase OafA/YrhL
VLLYRWKRLAAISESMGWLLVIGSIIGIVAFHQIGLTDQVAAVIKHWVGEKWHTELTFSKFFLSDYLLGVLVFLNFAGVRRVSDRLAALLIPLERPIRFLAGYTLSLYLLHQPLFLFWGSVIRGDASGFAYWWLTTGLVAVSVFAAGTVTENRRYLLKRWLEQQLLHIQSLVPAHYVARL